ncbi:sn-glycerol-3-phosphate ABC transporter permease [Williamsoniiplasma somnilux]|uniref:sn-glycerol-3-phosphate ABC transporter permease n=1 Tax=Williamsoniiplasma somnilux TaxID=215578 RepID=A0A2K8NXU4_9MOLU|nr:carbohydrate ABC transporter permease [Williamsoniiplasma somnilux]ATZ18564.1 sn-glycerol-3-phosphate ABC transporter permease [Williamsoniiplasma somnilux]
MQKNNEIKTFEKIEIKIREDYIENKKNIKSSFDNKIANQNNKLSKRSLKEERFVSLKNNLEKYKDNVRDYYFNGLKAWFVLMQLSFVMRSLRFHYHITNFWFIKSVNRKIMFTASMAGESLGKKILGNFIKTVFILIMMIVFLFPFYWMISVSFRSSDEITEGIKGSMSLWPKEWTWDAYDFLFNNPNAKISIGSAIGSSFLIAIISTIVQIFVSLLGGFGLSYINSRYKEVFIMIILATMMLPGEALLIGQYMIITDLQLKNTLIALIIPFIGNAFTIYMFKNAFDSINDSVKKAAKVDGLSNWQFFIKIAIPYVRATIFTAILISFIASWNSILWPTMVIKQDSQFVTLPMILWQIMQSSGISGDVWNMDGSLDPQNLKMAASIVAILPMFIIFVFTKKYLVKGITSNSGAKE